MITLDYTSSMYCFSSLRVRENNHLIRGYHYVTIGTFHVKKFVQYVFRKRIGYMHSSTVHYLSLHLQIEREEI